MNERFLDYPGLQKYDQKIKQHIADNAPDSPSVTSVNGKTGAVSLSASDVGAIPTSRTVNGKALNTDIALTASDVGATGKTMPEGQVVQIHRDGTTATIEVGAEVFNDYRDVTFTTASSGDKYYDWVLSGNLATGAYAHAEGTCTRALANYSHAEGYRTVASAEYETYAYTHAEGETTIASGTAAHAEGSSTMASGAWANAEGLRGTASGSRSHVGGDSSVASGDNSFAHGQKLIASGLNQFVIGAYNVASDSQYAEQNDKLIIGCGKSTTRANCFRVRTTGVYAAGEYSSTGADYAELFEWEDGNPGDEDRVARFVTLDGEKIRLANSKDDFILGIISGNPSVVGDVHDDQWQGMFMVDICGRPIWEEVEVPDETGEFSDPENPDQMITRVIRPAHIEHRRKVNPDYDPSQPYIPRSERPEWGCVGMIGKLAVIDDGTCQVNGWAKPASNGTATRSLTQTKYRVLSRINEEHIRVLIL